MATVVTGKYCFLCSSQNIVYFNSHYNFTLAGTKSAIELDKDTISTLSTLSNIKTKALDTTHGLHSTLVDGVVPELEKLG
jgi:hypothetical protein